MFSDERKVKILEFLSKNFSITVADLAEEFSVSETTIRRDLQDLEIQGQLKRTHGGAIALDAATFEPSLQEKVVYHPHEKSQIALAAVSLIRPGDTILLDSGTTTLNIATHLPEMEITVVTNSLSIGQELSSKKHIHLTMLGGDLRATTGAFVGPMTELMLGQLNVDKLFLGANGVDLNRGVTTPNVIEAATKKAMMKCAREVVLVADHSKFGTVNLVKICDMSDVDIFVTDSTLSKEFQLALSQDGVMVICSDTNSLEDD